MEPFKYWAFISYSHADARWAEWLHKSLERYRIPARLVGRDTPTGTVPKKLFPIFRDRDELAGSSELGNSLREALAQSRFQIVIASPNSARSRWVGEEIRYFKSLGRSSRVLALIVDGEPHASDKGQPECECFPDALRFHVDAQGALTRTPAEQVAADARKHADGKSNALLKLIAGLLGVGFDDLRQRELQARNRRLAVLASVATGISAITVALAIAAVSARNDALRRQQQAEDLLQFMLGDLRDKLEPIGKLSILDAVGNKAMDYFATLDQKDLTDTALSSRAKALRQLGDVRLKRGDMTGASEAFVEALKLDEELAKRHPQDAELLHNVSQSQYAVGQAHYLKGEFDRAMTWWRLKAETTQKLLDLEPDQPEWAHDFANAHMNLGALELNDNKLDNARAEFETALARQQTLVAKHGDQIPYLFTLSGIDVWLYSLEAAQHHWQKAVDYADQSARTLRHIVELAPENVPYQKTLVDANLQMLYARSHLEALTPDDAVLREALQLTENLTTLDPENIEYAKARLTSLNYLVSAYLYQGHWNGAAEKIAQELEIARALFRKAQTNNDASESLLGILSQAIQFALLRKDASGARALLQEGESLELTPEQAKAGQARLFELALLDWRISLRTPQAAERQAQAEKLLGELQASGQPVRPSLMLDYEALKGDSREAGQWLAKLTDVERRHPFVQSFCRETGTCTESPGSVAAPSIPGEPGPRRATVAAERGEIE